MIYYHARFVVEAQMSPFLKEVLEKPVTGASAIIANHTLVFGVMKSRKQSPHGTPAPSQPTTPKRIY